MDPARSSRYYCTGKAGKVMESDGKDIAFSMIKRTDMITVVLSLTMLTTKSVQKYWQIFKTSK